MAVEILYTFTPAAITGVAAEREIYWDDVLQEGGCRESATKRARGLYINDEMEWVYTTDSKQHLQSLIDQMRRVNRKRY